jgi:hypothetical protein
MEITRQGLKGFEIPFVAEKILQFHILQCTCMWWWWLDPGNVVFCVGDYLGGYISNERVRGVHAVVFISTQRTFVQ